MGRILVTRDKSGRQRSRCANCGLESDGGPKALCACGKRTHTNKDAGHRCIRNPAHVPGSGQEIIVTVGNPVEHRRPETARGPEGKYVAPTSRVPDGQGSLAIEGDGHGDQ